MAKKHRRSPLQVLEDRTAEIAALEKKRDHFQKLADGGNTAAALAVVRITLLIARIVQLLRYRRAAKKK